MINNGTGETVQRQIVTALIGRFLLSEEKQVENLCSMSRVTVQTCEDTIIDSQTFLIARWIREIMMQMLRLLI